MLINCGADWTLDSKHGRAGVRLTIDLSQGHAVDHINERFLLFHLGLLVPPFQVPEKQCEYKEVGR